MSSPDRLVLAIDVGSSSIRCSAFLVADSDIDNGDKVPTVRAIEGCSASKKMQSVQPNTGKINVYLKNGRSIFDMIDTCVDEAMERIRQHYRSNEEMSFAVIGVGFSTFVMNLIAVDEEGRPIGNDATLSYACNTPEVAGECERLRSELGPDKLASMYQRTGAPLHSAYALPQLRAFYSTASPDMTAQIHKWTTLASICIDRWTRGVLKQFEFAISLSEASWTGMYGFRGTEWDEEVKLSLPCDARTALPRIMDFDTMPGDLPGIPDNSPYWDRWPELRDYVSHDQSPYCCRLSLGIGDGACANIGSKCTTRRRIAVTIGTSAAARIVLPLPLDRNASQSEETKTSINIPSGLFCYRIDARNVLVGGALTDGGSVVEWIRSIFNLTSDGAFVEVMTRIERKYKDENGDSGSTLTCAPFLSGERSTGFRAGATGVLAGITRKTTADDIIQSFLEGVVLRLNHVLKLIIDTRQSLSIGTEEERPVIMASGNGLVNNPLVMQMLSDCSGLRVLVDAETSEATSRGVALMLAVALKRKSLKSRAHHDAAIDTLGEEGISTLQESVPGRQASMWASKSASQEDLIDSVSPIWE